MDRFGPEGIAPGQAANSIPRVMVKLKDLSCVVSSLREKVDALRARLDIALRPGSEPSPVNGRGLNKAPQEQPSPLADNLEHNIEALGGLGNDLNDMLFRLEL